VTDGYTPIPLRTKYRRNPGKWPGSMRGGHNMQGAAQKKKVGAKTYVAGSWLKVLIDGRYTRMMTKEEYERRLANRV
jgi:hypothetical protein